MIYTKGLDSGNYMKLFVPITVAFIGMMFVGISLAANTTQTTIISPLLQYNLTVSVPQSLINGWSITANKVNTTAATFTVFYNGVATNITMQPNDSIMQPNGYSNDTDGRAVAVVNQQLDLYYLKYYQDKLTIAVIPLNNTRTYNISFSVPFSYNGWSIIIDKANTSVAVFTVSYDGITKNLTIPPSVGGIGIGAALINGEEIEINENYYLPSSTQTNSPGMMNVGLITFANQQSASTVATTIQSTTVSPITTTLINTSSNVSISGQAYNGSQGISIIEIIAIIAIIIIVIVVVARLISRN